MKPRNDDRSCKALVEGEKAQSSRESAISDASTGLTRGFLRVTSLVDENSRSVAPESFDAALSCLSEGPTAENALLLEHAIVDSLSAARFTRTEVLLGWAQDYSDHILQLDFELDPDFTPLLAFYNFRCPSKSMASIISSQKEQERTDEFRPSVPMAQYSASDASDERLGAARTDSSFVKLDKLIVDGLRQIFHQEQSAVVFDNDSSKFFRYISDAIPNSKFFELLSLGLFDQASMNGFTSGSHFHHTRIATLVYAGKVLDLKKQPNVDQKVWLQTLGQLADNLPALTIYNALRNELQHILKSSLQISTCTSAKLLPNAGVFEPNLGLIFSALNDIDVPAALAINQRIPTTVDPGSNYCALSGETWYALSYLSSYFDALLGSGRLVFISSNEKFDISRMRVNEPSSGRSLFELVNGVYLDLLMSSIEALYQVSADTVDTGLTVILDDLCKRCYSILGSASLPFLVSSFASIIVNVKLQPRKAVKRIDSLTALLSSRGISGSGIYLALSRPKIVCLDRLGRDRESWDECGRLWSLNPSNDEDSLFCIEHALKSAYNLKLDSTVVSPWISRLNVCLRKTESQIESGGALYYAIRYSYSLGDRDELPSLLNQFFNTSDFDSVDMRMVEVGKIRDLIR